MFPTKQFPIPNLIIIGAQKSASTSLQLALSQHPQISIKHGETPVLEDPDFTQGALSSVVEQLSAVNTRIVGIKRPSYLARPEVPIHIARHLPKAKLVAVLRNPYDRLVSAYHHYVATGFLPAVSLEQGLSSLVWKDDFAARWPRGPEVLNFGLYADHLDNYESQDLHPNLLVLRSEDLYQRWEMISSRISIFLEVEQQPFSDFSFPLKNSRKPNLFLCGIEGWISRRTYTYSADGKRLTEPGPGLRQLPRRVLAASAIPLLRKFPLPRLSSQRAQGIDQLSPALQDYLRELYEPQIARLETKWGYEVRHWSRA